MRCAAGRAGRPACTVGAPWATGLHQVDNPVFDPGGNLLVTYSGPRGQEAPVSVFRVTPSGARQPFVSGIVNATSLAFGPDGSLYVSSRFDGAVYRIDESGTPVQVASDLGVACGLAFDAEGWMYVGDRSGTVFRVRDGTWLPFVTLPPSVAAFHLAMSPDGELFVTAPTLGLVRPRLPDRSPRLRSAPCRRFRPPAGPGVRARRLAPRGRRAGRRRRCVPFRRPAVGAGAGDRRQRTGRRRVRPTARASWPPTTRPTGSTPAA